MKLKLIILLIGFGTRNLSCNAQGQATIEVSFDKTVYLVFPSDIKSHDIGSPDVSHKAEGNKIFLKSNLFEDNGSFYDQDDVEVDWFDTNMLVETVDGLFFVFDITYKSSPEKFFYAFEEGDATYKNKSVKRKENYSEQDDDFGDNITMVDAIKIKEVCAAIAESEDIVGDLGDVEGRMQTKIGGIYADRDYLYFKISLWNESSIPYDIELINFVIDVAGKKQRKLTASFKDNLTPIYVLNKDAELIKGDEEIYKVFVYEKFTIDPKKRLFVQVIEENGDRDTEVEIRPKNILEAASVLNLMK